MTPSRTFADTHDELRQRVAAANRVASERLVRLRAALEAAKETHARLTFSGVGPSGTAVFELRTQVESLRRQLASQPVIEQAKGIIMANSHCDEDQAFEILRRASQRTNVKLREVARQLVEKTAAEQAVRPTDRFHRGSLEPLSWPGGQHGRRPA
jgi:ANTAR domain